MAAPVTENESQREQRLADVARLSLMGQTQAAIGRQLCISQPQVSYDLKIIRRRWVESQIRDFDEARAVEIAKLDDIEREFRGAWVRSQQPKQVMNSKRKEGAGASSEASVRKEEQPGDPRFLDGVMKCIAKRCEILGLDAPKKTAFTNSDGTTDYGPFLTEDERRSRLLAVLGEFSGL